MEAMKWVLNKMPKSDDKHLGVMSTGNVEKAQTFHRSFPQYSVTPLARLDRMAAHLGLGSLYVKDESYRFGLNAFKVLGERPTHVFVQAGVGSLAGAVVGYFANLYPNDLPKFVVMEAQIADCLYQGALAGDGKPRMVGGDLQTIMAGLACGEPNTISWDILRNHADAFVSCPDWVSAKGMRMLAAPVKGDVPVTSGESGAVGMGVISTLMEDENYKELKEALGLDQNSRVLMFSTEGDTDPEKYRKIVWGGEYATV